MKPNLSLLLFVATLALSAGCAGFGAPVVPPTGLVYTSIRAPIDIDSDQTQLGTKRGESSSQSVLGIAAWGDASTRAAAENGGITTIRHADYEFYTVLGLYSKFTTIVHGD